MISGINEDATTIKTRRHRPRAAELLARRNRHFETRHVEDGRERKMEHARKTCTWVVKSIRDRVRTLVIDDILYEGHLSVWPGVVAAPLVIPIAIGIDIRFNHTLSTLSL